MTLKWLTSDTLGDEEGRTSLEIVIILNLKLLLNGVENTGLFFSFKSEMRIAFIQFNSIFLEANSIIWNGHNFNCKLAHSDKALY